MATPKKSIFKRLKESQWFMTLTSTTLGVLLGLYLTNYYADKSLKEGKEEALKQIINELNDNEKELKAFNELLTSNYNSLIYVFSKLDEDERLIVHKDSVDVFLQKSKGFFEFHSAEKFDVDRKKLRGEIDMQINSTILFKGLSDIVWTSYKQTDYTSITGFQCLTNLEGLYNFQNEVDKLNNQWKKMFYNITSLSKEEYYNDFLPKWKKLIEQQNFLLQAYEHKNETFEKCK